MEKPSTPENEKLRQAELDSYQIIGSAEQADLDFLTEIAAQVCGTSIALVSLITNDRQWFLSHHGLNARETPRELSFCAHAINKPNEVLVVENSLKDHRFFDNPLVTGEPHVIFYSGVPLLNQRGFVLGTLCVIGHTPKKLTEQELKTLRKLAQQVLQLLELRRQNLILEHSNIDLNKTKNLFNEMQRINKIGAWELDIETGKTFWTEEVYLIHEVDHSFDHNQYNGIDFYHSEDRSVISSAVENAILSGKPFDTSCRFITKQGNVKWVRATGKKIINDIGKPFLTGAFQDITEQKQKEAQLAFISKEILDITNAVNESSLVSICDKNGNIIRANELFCKVSGYTEKELTGKNHNIINSGYHDSAFWKEMWVTIASGKVWKGEIKNLSKDGREYWVSSVINPIFDEQGNIIQYLSIRRDISKRKQVEEELKIAKEIAENANRAKSEFLANMSHEIRTPMNAILGFTELLHSELQDEKMLYYTNSISSSGKILLQLINDFLDLSKIESGKIELVYDDVDIRQILEEVQNIFFLKIQEKHLQFSLEIDSLVPDFLLLDKTRLRQVLINLIGNAVKFTDSGYIKVRCNIDSNSTFVIQIEDTGKGIPKEEQRKIFESFTQVKGQDSGKYGGTGLGLSICKKLVEIMNGEVLLKSEVGKGSLFSIVLRDIKIPVNVQKRKVDHFQVSNIDFEPAKILIADDVVFNRELVKGYLGKFKNLKMYEAENGKEAIDKAKEILPDLILMDMKMPEINGYTATQFLKKDPSTSFIPIIAFTASILDYTHKEIEYLCDDYVQKPVRHIDLIQKLAEYLPTYSILGQEILNSNSQNSFSINQPLSSKIQHPKELFQILNDKIENWKSIQDVVIIDDILEFSKSIIDIGNEYNYPELVSWAKNVEKYALLYDIMEMNQHLAGFPYMVHQLKNLNNEVL